MEMMIVLGNCWALGETSALLSASSKVSGGWEYNPSFHYSSLAFSTLHTCSRRY
jgi:hypothetical protein